LAEHFITAIRTTFDLHEFENCLLAATQPVPSASRPAGRDGRFTNDAPTAATERDQ
jgi:hypothetical protein